MLERTPPVITDNTPIGPDVDVDREDIRLANGTRLTNEVAEENRRAGSPLVGTAVAIR